MNKRNGILFTATWLQQRNVDDVESASYGRWTIRRPFRRVSLNSTPCCVMRCVCVIWYKGFEGNLVNRWNVAHDSVGMAVLPVYKEYFPLNTTITLNPRLRTRTGDWLFIKQRHTCLTQMWNDEQAVLMAMTMYISSCILHDETYTVLDLVHGLSSKHYAVVCIVRLAIWGTSPNGQETKSTVKI